MDWWVILLTLILGIATYAFYWLVDYLKNLR